MTLRVTLATAALAVAGLAGCGSDSGEVVIVGTWKGKLMQRGLEPFTVTATIGDLEDPAANVVRYTGIDCGGNWTFLGLDGSTYRFREVIDRGAGGTCKGTGVVTLKPTSSNSLIYEFRGGGVVSEGLLTRRG